MEKTVLITGSTDGIGLETAKAMAAEGHRVLLHGRSSEKLEQARVAVQDNASRDAVECYLADLSDLESVKGLAAAVSEKHTKLDVLINNAGIYGVPKISGDSDIDLRFVVNTIAPYLLTKLLLPLFDASGRVINLSSAAQAPVDLSALAGPSNLPDSTAYAQSKLALTMWSRYLAMELGNEGPSIVAVNPKSLLGSKMVKEAYGMQGADLSIGADILVRAAMSDEFANASGKYFDNDSEQFAPPHPDALDNVKCGKLMLAMDEYLAARV